MKGTVIVSKKELDAHPGVRKKLEAHCENVVKKDDAFHFQSKDGVLMTMICTLLDNEVQYTLSFSKTNVFEK